jgi:predicted AAA+ superfamily ATPase
MTAADLKDRFDHPSWRTAAGTVASYLAILTVLFLLFFVVPFIAFLALG